MGLKNARGFVLLIAATGLAGALTAMAAVATAKVTTGVVASASFRSVVAAATADCPSLGRKQVLVLGRGEALGGPFGSFNTAVGTAAECSQGTSPPTPVPKLGNCNNVRAKTPFFHVHGKGFYMTPDGSVLYLIYEELSENPFVFGAPPFNLHDCGVWQVDGKASTGIFHGAKGSGSITANVPVAADFSAIVSADYIGKITLDKGSGAPGSLKDVACTGKMTDAPITGNVTVADGASCDLVHSAVNGNVVVAKGGSLTMRDSVVNGKLLCNGCTAATSVNSTVYGNFSIKNEST
jgi:hypothetical protein